MSKVVYVAVLASAAFAFASPTPSIAQSVAQTAGDFQNRPIRIVVLQAAGSGTDLVARLLAQKMGELWGHQGVVENRPGADGILAMESSREGYP